jgi:hypothetical protein
MEPSDALRCGIQVGFRATGSFHQAETRHQRLRRSVHAVAEARLKGLALRASRNAFYVASLFEDINLK